MNLIELKNKWVDSPQFHSEINSEFTKNVNAVQWMSEYRTWVENNVFGFGERSFLWLWKLLVDEMGTDFSFLEIGVYKSQILTLIRMAASSTGRSVTRYGVTPLDERGIEWVSDYAQDIKTLHDTFFVPKDYKLYVGSSTDPEIINDAKKTAPYDIIYIDGSHEYEDVVSDFKHYAPMVKRGGYLVVDDCNNDLQMEFGYFQGIEPVTRAKIEYMQQYPNDWEFVFSVVHISVFRKK